MNIHSSSIIDPKARIHETVKVGAFCSIGPDVVIGAGTIIDSHVVIKGKVTIGEDNHFFSFTCVGEVPQDISYKGEETEVIIGDRNIFREFVSIHRGTLKEEGKTVIANDNLVMAYTHLGHDVNLGSHIRIVNSCNLAGHVHVGDRAIISGGSIIGQFVRIGKGVFIGGGSVIDKEVPHYCTAYGNRIKLKGINIIGLKRQGVDKNKISELVDFLRSMEASNLSPRAFIDSSEGIESYRDNKIVAEFADFISTSRIGIPSFIS